jgi:hypothetical protein
MNETQNLRISLSDLPLGSKSAPPLPPPMLTMRLVSIYSFLRVLVQGVHTASEGILKDLLKAQELENRQVDSRVEAETALVWTKSRVELHTVSLVDHALALVVLPYDAELDDALRDGDDLESLLVLGVLLED